MSKTWTLAAAMALLVGCTTTTTDDTGDANGDPNQMSDPYADLAADPACDGWEDPQDGEYYEIAGATGYWVGEFTFIGDGDVTGTETLVLFANDTWKEADPDVAMDCRIVYTVSGRRDFETCPGCDYQISLDATLDTAGTTCDDMFAVQAYGDSYGPANYNVTNICGADNAPCDTNLNFTSNGELLGVGQSAGDQLWYATERFCPRY